MDVADRARFLPPDGRAHAAAQVIALVVFLAGTLLEPAVDPVGADVAVIWGVLVMAAGSAAALVGTFVGLTGHRLRRTSRATTLLVGLVTGFATVASVLLLGGDGVPCAVRPETCGPAAREWIAGLVGMETVLLLHAVTSWNGRQLRRGWLQARRSA